MAYDRELAQRIRASLADHHVREVPMFGGLSFMVDDKILVSARGQGGMLVRCDPDTVDELLECDGVAWAEMRGRPMKRGWLHVEAATLDDTGLAHWIDIALSHRARLA